MCVLALACVQSAVRYERYKSASTLGEYYALGGSRADARYDIGRGFLIVLDGAADGGGGGAGQWHSTL